ncbi:MAG: Flp family type IVb pilin [Armatimonadota bacterium]|nr:Flp family type IVb pilin [Armatimonadota bacterium]MDR5703208.1 Flp family type IVb pilin [Armatimonadota bacterium]MDR7435513.1 Flp family type IVb pilin [Armatimonadota bacterium]
MQQWLLKMRTLGRRFLFPFETPGGQGMVEYVLIAAILAVGTLVAMTFLKEEVSALFTKIANTLKGVP